MKKCLILFVLLTAGCTSTDLEADHVEKERTTYNSLQPFVLKGIEGYGAETVEGKAGKLLNESWDSRIKSYEKRISERAK